MTPPTLPPGAAPTGPAFDPDALAWDKMGGLLPAIVQSPDGRVRMLGYMDRAALAATCASGKVTFASRSKGRLWTKGETSGHYLALRSLAADCDGDGLLVIADPAGPTCHTGRDSCFDPPAVPFFPAALEAIVAERAAADPQASYTARLAAAGAARIAQKVGEEGVEVALAGAAGDGDALVEEAADLVYHLTLLLRTSGRDWAAVSAVLARRHAEREGGTA